MKNLSSETGKPELLPVGVSMYTFGTNRLPVGTLSPDEIVLKVLLSPLTAPVELEAPCSATRTRVIEAMTACSRSSQKGGHGSVESEMPLAGHSPGT